MSRRSARSKAAALDAKNEDVPAKRQKLVATPGEDTDENEPPKPVEEAQATEQESVHPEVADAREGKEKLCFRIVHCSSWSVFRRNANAIGDELRQHFGDVEVSLNPEGKPKRGSFEIFLVKEEDVLLWSGISKGPPRKQKFPEPSKVVELTQEHLWTWVGGFTD